MHRFLFVAALAAFAACSHPSPAAAPVALPTQAEFDAAYKANHFDDCARMAKQVAPTSTHRETWLYNEACCEARAGKPDVAFATLDQAVAAGLRGQADLDQDTDLAALHTDARWQTFSAKLAAADAAFLATIGDPALRQELHDLVTVDQAARQAMITKDKDGIARVEASDAHSTARLHEIIAQHGWPGKKLVGADGAHDAWLLVQHADKDVAFQKECLALMKAAPSGEVTAIDIGYLDDRVEVAEGRPQIYGTQFIDGAPRPMVNPAHVDDRRKAIGLGTMAEYREQMRAMYGSSIK